MSKFNLDKAVTDIVKYQQIQIKGKAMNKHQDKIDKVKEWGFNIALDVNLDELMYYMYNCDGLQLKKDIFDEERFTDEYVEGKFHDFQCRFPTFLYSLSGNYKTLFCIAVHEFYQNNHKEKTDG